MSGSPGTPGTVAPGAGGQNRTEGFRSERESDAFTNRPIEVRVRDGRVQAGRGLEMIPARPRFSDTTQVTNPPRVLDARLTFRRDGRVANVEFINGTETGNPNIDGPIRNSLYRWRATGSRLSRLSETQTLSVVVRVSFN